MRCGHIYGGCKPMKIHSSSLMPFAFYMTSFVWLISTGLLAWGLFVNGTTPPPVFFIWNLFGVYLLFCFYKFRIVKSDNSKFYISNMLTFKEEVIERSDVVEEKIIFILSIIGPTTKVLIYLNKKGTTKKIWYAKKIGLT